MLLTASSIIDDFFDSTSAIRKMNLINGLDVQLESYVKKKNIKKK